MVSKLGTSIVVCILIFLIYHYSPHLLLEIGGIRGFARGLAPSVARSIPACATMFATGDKIQWIINRYLQHLAPVNFISGIFYVF
jgi:hypothetical protein